MSEFNVAAIIPCAENRIENLLQCVDNIKESTFQPSVIVVVCDGFSSISTARHFEGIESASDVPVHFIFNEKHVRSSGTVQPKNAGAKWATENTNATHFWFLDSDILVEETTLECYYQAQLEEFDYIQDRFERIEDPRIMIGPYEWMGTGQREIHPEIKNDPRWAMFEEFNEGYTSVGEINFAMANFGGNIIYPKDAFNSVGGFSDDLSAGRVEDGEMGLRCCAKGIPMCVVPKARGYHMEHERNITWILQTNEEEVPLINKWHPWVENESMFVADNDGKRFEYKCPDCGEYINTIVMFEHQKAHHGN